MSHQSQKINIAIESLVKRLVENVPGEDYEDTNERRENARDFVREVLDSQKAPAVVADINQASDLIKKKLIQTNTNPEKALRFTNLYSRLLTIPVIKQKWAVLYFLYQMSDQRVAEHQPILTSPSKNRIESRNTIRRTEEQSTRISHLQDVRDEQHALTEAFAPEGVRNLPGRAGGQRERQEENNAFRFDEAKTGQKGIGLKSTLLSDNYVDMDPTEPHLLRDLPFTLQGLSSSNLKFSAPTTLKLPTTLPPSIISLLHTLAEPSLLYRNLASFVQSDEGGLLGQSLRAAITSELRSYLGLVATLESQIRRALSSLDDKEPRHGIGRAGVTLKRCVVWTREATMGLRLMSLIAEESQKQRGGQLISLIHGFSSSHGDPMVGVFAERLLAHVTQPFYDMLRQWIYDGELSDPYYEFFVSEQDLNVISESNNGKGRGSASSVWEDKYKLIEEMVPSIITHDFAQKVFLIGKSLNFIRYGCGDSQWVEAYSKEASKELRYGDTATLEAWIDEAYKTTMSRLIHLMADKFHLFDHLKALKDYILLGQGDFIALLMESLANDLDRPAGAQYRHTLTAQLEHAIRGSNAQHDSAEVLRRLDARMLQLSHGDIGWDCFTLEYKIDAPVDVVVTEWGNRQYLKVFNFLWKVKRVEFALASTWRKCMTGARGVLSGGDHNTDKVWKSTRGVLAEMIHFIGQLQYYILFEVIESSWDELQSAIRKEGCTFDDLIKAHTKYLNAITHKGLLGAKKKSSGTDDDNTFMVQLGEILRLMLSYRQAVDGLYSWSVSDFTYRQGVGVRDETRGRFDDDDLVHTPVTGRLGPRILADATPMLSPDDNIPNEFPVLRERLQALGGHFKSRVSLLLGDLAYQPDVDMRFLGVAMNFNDVYQPVRKKSRAAPNREQAKATMRT